MSFKIIAGPCVIENRQTPFSIAEALKENLDPGIDFYFKASFKKANRTSIKSFSGINLHEAIWVLRRIKEEFDVKICTDVHEVDDIELIADFVDVIQIPAFLCRQTDLLVSAGQTGKIVNIKKGQFMSPESISWSAVKAEISGAKEVWITERGTTFGYTDLVVDATSIPRIQNSSKCPAILDVTHSLQKPNQGEFTGGSDKTLSRILMRQAAVSGAAGIFAEVHPDPSKSLSDKETILPLNDGIEWLNEAYTIFKSVPQL